MTITNSERQIGPHPNVTIRHARHAFHLLVSGALREIDAAVTDEPTKQKWARELFDNLDEERSGWEGAA